MREKKLGLVIGKMELEPAGPADNFYDESGQGGDKFLFHSKRGRPRPSPKDINLAINLFEFLGKDGNDLEKVPNDAIVGLGKDGSVWIGVDRNNHL